MRIYLDTCCLMRPFDNQSVPRIRLEALAVSDILEYIKSGYGQWIAGKAVTLEVMACRDARHLATAEVAGCDWLLTTDAEFVKRALRVRPKLSVKIVNPAEFIVEDIL